MKASELIKELADLVSEFGDLDCVFETANSSYSPWFEFEPGFGLADGAPAEVFLLNLTDDGGGS